jgi:phage gp46-like protein
MTLITENLPTYIVLDKDINLKYLGNGSYDRELINNDFNLVENIDSLHNGIRIKLMMIWGEMKNNPTYKSCGNRAYGKLKANNIKLTQVAIKDYFNTALNEMSRILSVDDIQVDTEQMDSNRLIVTYMVTTVTDQHIKGGVELV